MNLLLCLFNLRLVKSSRYLLDFITQPFHKELLFCQSTLLIKLYKNSLKKDLTEWNIYWFLKFVILQVWHSENIIFFWFNLWKSDSCDISIIDDHGQSRFEYRELRCYFNIFFSHTILLCHPLLNICFGDS